MLLEICASNYKSAINAQKSGAHRIELCSELAVGGITPSYGLLNKVMEDISIPVMVLIRPRSGDFVYSPADFDIMKRDIELCKELGCAGIVSGVLTADFKIDIRRTSELIELSRPLPFTFHRAFDHVVNPERAVVDLVNLGAKRILTSGQHSKAIDGIENLKKYQQIAGKDLIIMPGGGINKDSITSFISPKEQFDKRNVTSRDNFIFKEFHASATEILKQTSEEKIAMNSLKFLTENIEIISDIDNISKILKIIKDEI